jgi:hypothetical protein
MMKLIALFSYQRITLPVFGRVIPLYVSAAAI